MMNTPLKEWLNQTIAELEEERDATPGAVNEDAAMALEAMKLALASLEAEPVGIIVKHKVTGKFGSWLHSKADWFRSDEYEVLSAYTAPPASECLTRPVHPRISSEELDDETLDELIDFRRSTFEYHSQQGNKVQTIIHGVTLTAMIELKERRAAMLQDSENSESHSGIQASPALNFLPKKALSSSCNSQAASCCQCRTCRPVTMTDIRFVVCPECGNKHCPHTNDPRNACTGSNEPRKVARIQQHRSRR